MIDFSETLAPNPSPISTDTSGNLALDEVYDTSITDDYEDPFDKVFVASSRTALPDSLFSMPRYNPRSGLEYQGQFQNPAADPDYMDMLLGQALPGIMIALFSFFCSLLGFVIVLGTVIAYTRRQLRQMQRSKSIIPRAWSIIIRPKPFTVKQLKRMKKVIIALSLVVFVGCIAVLTTGMRVKNSMIKFGDVMLKSVVEVEESTLKIEEVLSRENVLENITIFVTKLNEDIATIKHSYSSVRTGLTSSSTGLQSSLITLSVFVSLLAFLAAFFVYVDQWKLVIVLNIVISIFTSLAWLLWSGITMMGTMTNDMCYSMQVFIEPGGEGYVDLMDILPCISAPIAVSSIGILRATIADRAYQINRRIVKNDPLMGLPLVCHEYVEVSAELTCDPAGRYAETNYAKTVCSAYMNGVLDDELNVGEMTFWPSVKGVGGSCGYGNTSWSAFGSRGHTVSAVNFEATYTVCENKEGCENSLPSKIPRVPYTESVDLSSSVAALVDIVPDTQKLLTCQYVKEAFESAVPLCDETISNLTYLWRGNSIVATALFGLWIALLLAVQRLSNKNLLVKNMMGAMKSFKAMKAGGKGSFLGGKVEIPPFVQRMKATFWTTGKELRGSPSFKPNATTRISKRFKKHVQAIGELRVKIKTLQMSKLRRLIANMTPRGREELKKQKLKEINAIWKQNAKRLSSLRKEEMSLSFRREESIKRKEEDDERIRRAEEAANNAERSITFQKGGEDSSEDDDNDDIYNSPETFATFQTNDDAADDDIYNQAYLGAPFSQTPQNEVERMLFALERAKLEAQKKETATQVAISTMMEQLGTARATVAKKTIELTSSPIESMLETIEKARNNAAKKLSPVAPAPAGTVALPMPSPPLTPPPPPATTTTTSTFAVGALLQQLERARAQVTSRATPPSPPPPPQNVTERMILQLSEVRKRLLLAVKEDDAVSAADDKDDHS